MKKTTAQRKEQRAMKKRTVLTVLPWVLCPPLAALACFFRFVLPGYSFTALVCCILICLILFYSLADRFGALLWVRRLRRVVTVLLCIGLTVIAATEAVIIHHSAGDPDEVCDYAVVLGAKVRHDGPSIALWDRIYRARDYLEANPDVIAIVSGGQGSDEHMTEARAMYNELVNLGIDPDRIWLEEKATSTRENLVFTLDLIEERTGQRPEHLGIVSSEYHMLRAGMVAKECGVEAVGIPAETSRLGQKINHFMREVAGVWFYLITGGD